MMKRLRSALPVVGAALAVVATAVGCGGGGGDETPYWDGGKWKGEAVLKTDVVYDPDDGADFSPPALLSLPPKARTKEGNAELERCRGHLVRTEGQYLFPDTGESISLVTKGDQPYMSVVNVGNDEDRAVVRVSCISAAP